MAILKKYLKSKSICKVTFTIPAKTAKSVALVGDFNNWKTDESGLKKLKNGTFKGTLDLPKNAAYEFKYIVDGEFVNDDNADRYQWNEYAGSENSVIDI